MNAPAIDQPVRGSFQSAQDYPAAHSMDTAWFAVDQEGNIGLFSTSEDGALPKAACDNRSLPPSEFGAIHLACFAEEYLAELKKVEKEADFNPDQFAPCALVKDAELKRYLQENCEWSLKACLVVLRIEDGGKLGAQDKARFERFGPWLISKRALTSRTIRRLAGLGTRPLDSYKMLSLMVDESAINSRVYTFDKEHGTDPGLYDRVQSPVCPMKAEEVPGDKVGAMRLPVKFNEEAQVHLADFITNDEASYWGDDWALRWSDMPGQKT
jgi:hypothetical protein